MREQIQVMKTQLDILHNIPRRAPRTSQDDEQDPADSFKKTAPAFDIKELVTPQSNIDAKIDKKNTPPHTPATRINLEKIGFTLSNAQKDWLDNTMNEYQRKFAASKAYTQEHRKYLADPRSVSGFSPEWKEIIFPLVTERSKGSKIWDINGNELIDTTNGFGPILFGHSPEFVTNSVIEQIEKGIETGPQSLLAGEVAKLFCEITGNERCAFASTGSEAVAGAIRIASTVTGAIK